MLAEKPARPSRARTVIIRWAAGGWSAQKARNTRDAVPTLGRQIERKPNARFLRRWL